MVGTMDYLRETKTQETNTLLEDNIAEVHAQGFEIEFGHIGQKTTYAMIYNEDHSIEIVGYTFIKDTRFYIENVGKLRALQQARARQRAEASKGDSTSRYRV